MHLRDRASVCRMRCSARCSCYATCYALPDASGMPHALALPVQHDGPKLLQMQVKVNSNKRSLSMDIDRAGTSEPGRSSWLVELVGRDGTSRWHGELAQRAGAVALALRAGPASWHVQLARPAGTSSGHDELARRSGTVELALRHAPGERAGQFGRASWVTSL